MRLKKFAAAVSLACAGLAVSPATWAAFPGAGVDNVQSLAQFKVTFTQTFAFYLRDKKNAPFCVGFDKANYDCPASARTYTSPMMYEPNTKVGRSDPHQDGDGTDEMWGADICKTGNTSSCTDFFSWTQEPILDAHFQWKENGYQADGFPFDEGPTGREEVHTQVVSFKLNPLRRDGSATAVRAGAQAPCQARSLGEVESLNGSGFPAESFFQMYVDVDVDFNKDGNVDLVLFNMAGDGQTIIGGDPLIIESTNLKSFPPKVIYSHTGRTGDKVAPKLYIGVANRARTGTVKQDCQRDPNPEFYFQGGEEERKHIGWIRIATHGIGFGDDNIEGDQSRRRGTKEGERPDQCQEGESDIACFSRTFNSLPMMPVVEAEKDPPPDPEFVELESVMAMPVGKSIVLGWKTASEVNNAGFHVWRARKDERGNFVDIVKLTKQLVPTQGVSHTGVTYSYVDDSITVPATYFYAVEDVEFNGKSKIHLEHVVFATVQ